MAETRDRVPPIPQAIEVGPTAARATAWSAAVDAIVDPAVFETFSVGRTTEAIVDALRRHPTDLGRRVALRDSRS